VIEGTIPGVTREHEETIRIAFDQQYPVAQGHKPPSQLDLIWFKDKGHRVGDTPAIRAEGSRPPKPPPGVPRFSPPPPPARPVPGVRDPSGASDEADPVAVQRALDLFHGVVPEEAAGDILPSFATDDPLDPYSTATGEEVRAALDNRKRDDVQPMKPPEGPAGSPTPKPKENTMSTSPANGGAAAAAAPAPLPPPSPTLSRAPQSIAGIAPGLGIAPARRRQGIMRVCITAASGAGKTFTAILMAKGFLLELGLGLGRRGKDVPWWNYDPATGDPEGPARILIIDTEAGSSMDYEHLVAFDVIRIDKPYTIQRYRDAYEQGVSGGYDVVIIDSGSHLWAGSGGLREEVDVVNKNSKSKFEGWSTIGPKWEEFKSSIIVSSKMHLIVTFRAKSAYEIRDGKRVKVGVDPISRDEIEFEFTVGFEMTQENKAQIDKDRTGLFKDRGYFTPDEGTGRELMKWRRSGAAELPQAAAGVRPGAVAGAPPAVQAAAVAVTSGDAPTIGQRDETKTLRTKLGLDLADVKRIVWGDEGRTVKTAAEAEELLVYLRQKAADMGVSSEGGM